MTPGPMLAAMKTTEVMAARAEAMTFMMVVPVFETVWKRCGSNDDAGADAGGDEDDRADGGECGGENVHG